MGYHNFIDKTGKIAIHNLKLGQPGNFHEGLATTKIFFNECDRPHGEYANNAKCLGFGYINTHGEIVIEPRFLSAGDFSEGIAVVQDFKRMKYGYIKNPLAY